jgi:hypothetical protein
MVHERMDSAGNFIAPSFVEFYSADWKSIGTKEILQASILEITGISPKALIDGDLTTFNVAEKMSWAVSRTTTRLEDKAYSLLRIFQVNMPLLYGEGSRAFLRLQEEIIKSTGDYTIFAWPGAVDPAGAFTVKTLKATELTCSLLAPDASEFSRSKSSSWQYSDFVRITRKDLDTWAPESGQDTGELGDLVSDDNPPTITGRGLRSCLPLMHLEGQEYLACTNYKLEDFNQ